MNEQVNFKELRDKLSVEDIKRILAKYDVKPVRETDNYVVFPTACHNVSGGSPKLYYYTDTRLFKCYTQCEGAFDIFELLMKIHDLRGSSINIFTAIRICGLDWMAISESNTDPTSTKQTSEYFYNLLHQKSLNIELPQIELDLPKRFTFDMKALKIWEQEGISFNTMLKYNIRFDPINNCIVIPNFDVEGKLIGVRGRYFDGDAKYKPIVYNQQVLSYPSSSTLYGIHLVKDAIAKQGKVIIFEGEKSVLKMDTLYGKDNIAVATLGKNISTQQIRQLSKLGVREVILAYDADYLNYDELDRKRNEYIKIAKPLSTYFNVCILMDMDMNLLKYKDSPIDQGKEAFEQIFKNRLYIC